MGDYETRLEKQWQNLLVMPVYETRKLLLKRKK